MVALARGMLDDPRWGWHAAAALGAEVPRAQQYLRVRPEALGARRRARSGLSTPWPPCANLAIDAERLWGEIMETAIGGTPKGGICRLTLTDLDRQVRDWFKARAGCRVTTDDMGACFRAPRWRGEPSADRIEHLDTQPTGGNSMAFSASWPRSKRCAPGQGRLDLCALRNWTNEEGSRFAPAMVSSGVFARVLEKDWAQSRQDRDGTTFAAALDAIGYRGRQRGESAFFELHTSRALILEAEEGRRRGHRRAGDALVRGDTDRPGAPHTGTTPMHLRKNAFSARPG